MASQRLKKELKELETEPVEGCTAKLAEDGKDITKWTATVKGPPDTPYEGGTFHLNIIFPRDYPCKPPFVKAVTRIFHPNINSQGLICLDILKQNWAPSLTISKVLLSISALLCEPNPDNPMDEAANLYINNREEYNRKAREMTQQHAM